MACKSKSIYVFDSSKRYSGHISAPEFNIKTQLTGVTKVELLQLKIPNIQYNVTSNNNKISFSVGGAPVTTATIPPGAYDINSLRVAIRDQMNIASGLVTFDCNYSLVTHKVTILNTAANFMLAFGSGTDQINAVIGFESINTASAATHTGTKTYNLDTVPPYYYLDIVQVPGYVYSANGSQRSTFAVMNFSNNGEYLVHSSNSNYDIATFSCGTTINGTIQLVLRDNNFNMLDMDVDWYAIIEFSRDL